MNIVHHCEIPIWIKYNIKNGHVITVKKETIYKHYKTTENKIKSKNENRYS